MKKMTISIDKQLTEHAMILAHELDTNSLNLGERLSSRDFETLQKAAKIYYRLARNGVPSIPRV